MSQELKLEVGKSYRTRGGWKATVVWDKRLGPHPLVVIHHHRYGDVVACHMHNGKWSEIVSSSREDIIAPWVDAPVITDWPKWAKAAAMDENGAWYWYDTVPHIDGGWDYGAEHCSLFHLSEVPKWKGDWKDSLVVKEDAR